MPRARLAAPFRLSPGPTVLLAMVCLIPVHAAAVPMSFGGNTYDRIDVAGLTWAGAKAAAEAQVFSGVSGHLAVITSLAEDQFIINSFDVFTDVDPGGVGFGPWIGLSCTSGAGCASVGSYEWVTGEAVTYNGFGTAEPSGDSIGGGGVQYLDFRNGWNDSAPSEMRPPGYIVEFENVLVPEPSSALLVGAGLLALSRARRRQSQ